MRQVGCSLTSIDLSNNLISDAGASALTAALQACEVAPRLLQFSLAGNPLTPTGCEACEQALAARADLALSLPSSAAHTGGAPTAGGGSATALGHRRRTHGGSATALNEFFEGKEEEEELTFEVVTERLTALGAGEPARAIHVSAIEALLGACEAESQQAKRLR